ncbi:hypothetical protein YC2023_100557 [Brassica napus]
MATTDLSPGIPERLYYLLRYLFAPSTSIEKALVVHGDPLTRRPDPEVRGLDICRTIFPDKIYYAINVHAWPPSNLTGRFAYSGEDNSSTTFVFYPSSGSISSIFDNHLRLSTACFAWSGVDEQASEGWARPIKRIYGSIYWDCFYLHHPSLQRRKPYHHFLFHWKEMIPQPRCRAFVSVSSSVCYLVERSPRDQKMQPRLLRQDPKGGIDVGPSTKAQTEKKEKTVALFQPKNVILSSSEKPVS